MLIYGSFSSPGSPKLAKVVKSITAVALVGPNVMRFDLAKKTQDIDAIAEPMIP
jgi:hypothetical protein